MVDLFKTPENIDGISQDAISELRFLPEGILQHEYFPVEYVIVTEVNNDLSYITSYWLVTNYWQAHLTRKRYDRFILKFLSGDKIIIDYRDPQNLAVFMPNEIYKDGFHEMYKLALGDLKTMNREQVDEYFHEIGYDPAFPLVDRDR